MLETTRQLQPGTALEVFQRSADLVRAAHLALLEPTRNLGPRADGLDDALLIWFHNRTEKACGASIREALDRVKLRKEYFVRFYDEATAHAELKAFLAQFPEPRDHNSGLVAWFTQPHYEWLQRVSGIEIPTLLRIFQRDDRMQQYAAAAINNINTAPPEAYLPEEAAPVGLPGHPSPQLVDQYINIQDEMQGLEHSQQDIVDRVQQDLFPDPEPLDVDLHPRPLRGPGSSPQTSPRPSRALHERYRAAANRRGEGSRPEFENLMRREFPPSPPKGRGVGPRTSPRSVRPTTSPEQAEGGEGSKKRKRWSLARIFPKFKRKPKPKTGTKVTTPPSTGRKRVVRRRNGTY